MYLAPSRVISSPRGFRPFTAANSRWRTAPSKKDPYANQPGQYPPKTLKLRGFSPWIRRIGSSTTSTLVTAESGTRTSRCTAMMRSPVDSLRTISLPSRAMFAMVSLPIPEERRTRQRAPQSDRSQDRTMPPASRRAGATSEPAGHRVRKRLRSPPAMAPAGTSPPTTSGERPSPGAGPAADLPMAGWTLGESPVQPSDLTLVTIMDAAQSRLLTCRFLLAMHQTRAQVRGSEVAVHTRTSADAVLAPLRRT